MFKKNTTHLQPNLFGLLNSLPDNMQKKVKQSEEFHFYNLIFRNIPEDLFKPLFSDKESRPNSPINAMVSALILMHRRTWTYEELFKQIQFHILVRIALGLDTLDEVDEYTGEFPEGSFFHILSTTTIISAATDTVMLNVFQSRFGRKANAVFEAALAIPATRMLPLLRLKNHPITIEAGMR